MKFNGTDTRIFVNGQFIKEERFTDFGSKEVLVSTLLDANCDRVPQSYYDWVKEIGELFTIELKGDINIKHKDKYCLYDVVLHIAQEDVVLMNLIFKVADNERV